MLVELIASAFILLNVWLLSRERIENFYWGIAGCVLYAWVFWSTGLIANALLQLLVFIPAQLYGWVNWAEEDDLKPTWITSMPVFLLSSLTLTGGVWFVLSNLTTNPGYADWAITGLSIAASVLVIYKAIESWFLWIAVDVIAIPLFIFSELWFTAALYCVLLCNCLYGLYNWAGRKHVVQ